ncbi:MAG: hypothetical protein PHS93_01640 [Candidatus Omnitrophica bacterium]|nr:hypothetical protein [Candidatus Omnitrophota bacterium]MDD5351854.1 hypothetical protein [Candidatus Omnitrophota bacterium]MDD5550680.1 hypothetical protein [Candidatus Omnitrophota bacterium]
MKRTLINLLVVIFLFSFISLSFAKEEIVIVVSGQSHASLYPCRCPRDPAGGVSRRATAIKKIRNENKNVLVLETGGSFAGGSYDGSTQTTEIDKERTKFYMGSLAKMGCDAFLISSEEFNFGDGFLKDAMSQYKFTYLSANIKDNFQPYLIKEIGDVKIAIIGITNAEVKSKTQLPYVSPKEFLPAIIKEVKEGKKADVVMVLSYLGEEQSQEILNGIKGVDVWIDSNNPFKSASNTEVNGVVFIQTAWQSRELTKINLTIEPAQSLQGDQKPLSVKTEHIDLNKDIEDDSEISAIIPSCFTDKDCRKPGFVPKCENAGKLEAKCIFSEIKPVKLTIIKPVTCKTCNIESALERIKNMLPNLEAEYITEDTKDAKALIEKLRIKMLPAYLINQPSEEVISQISQIAKSVDSYYVLEPGFTGVSYLTDRKEIPNRLDVFFDTGTKNITQTLEVLQSLKSKNKDIDMHINFLAIEEPESGFIAKGGRYEIEEFLRAACINKYYPDKIWDYLSCRLSDIESSWWDDCTLKFDIDSAKLKSCAQGEEGKELLRGFIKLTQELEVVFGPTFLVNNKEIFSSEGVPSVEELEKLFPPKAKQPPADNNAK